MNLLHAFRASVLLSHLLLALLAKALRPLRRSVGTMSHAALVARSLALLRQVRHIYKKSILESLARMM